VESGSPLPDRIEWVKFSSVAWLAGWQRIFLFPI
jgi:hypothetical protein